MVFWVYKGGFHLENYVQLGFRFTAETWGGGQVLSEEIYLQVCSKFPL